MVQPMWHCSRALSFSFLSVSHNESKDLFPTKLTLISQSRLNAGHCGNSGRQAHRTCKVVSPSVGESSRFGRSGTLAVPDDIALALATTYLISIANILLQAYATLLASLAFVASAVQWHLAHKRFGKALSTRTNTGMIILGLGAWFSILAMVVGHPLRARPLHPLSWVGKRSGATTPTAATLPQSKEV